VAAFDELSADTTRQPTDSPSMHTPCLEAVDDSPRTKKKCKLILGLVKAKNISYKRVLKWSKELPGQVIAESDSVCDSCVGWGN
jgi:hypothetical protein